MNLIRSEEIEIQLKTVKKQWHETLKNVHIIVFLRDGEWKTHSKQVVAKIRKVTPYENELYQSEENELDAVLTINQEAWAQMSVEQKTACLDHELCHICFDSEKDGIQIITHDVEEFAIVIKRHGLWHPDLQHFSENVAQTTLFNKGNRPISSLSIVDENGTHEIINSDEVAKMRGKKESAIEDTGELNEQVEEMNSVEKAGSLHEAKFDSKTAKNVEKLIKNMKDKKEENSVSNIDATVGENFPQTIETSKGKKVVFNEEQKKRAENELGF